MVLNDGSPLAPPLSPKLIAPAHTDSLFGCVLPPLGPGNPAPTHLLRCVLEVLVTKSEELWAKLEDRLVMCTRLPPKATREDAV